MEPLISVIVPIYNAEKYIKRCLESILNQTYKNIEIIVIDDGSSDKSINIIKKSFSENSRIKLFSQNNSGAYLARINGVKKSSGEYIMFVDSDDWIDKEMIDELWKNTEQGKIDFVMCGLVIECGKIKKTNCVPQKRIFNSHIKSEIVDFFLNESISGPYCKLIKKSLFDNLDYRLPVRMTLQEDLCLNIKLLEKVNSFVSISNNLYHYYINNESITKKYEKNKFKMTSYAYGCIYNFFYGSIDDYDLNRIKWIYFKNLYSAIIDLNMPTSNLSIEDKKKTIRNYLKSNETKNEINEIKFKLLDWKKRLLITILRSNSVNIIYFICFLMYCLKYKFKIRI